MLNFKRHLKDAGKNIDEYKISTILTWILMTIFSVIAMGLILTLFTVKKINSNIEQRVSIQAYVKEGITQKQNANLKKQILATKNVRSVGYSSKKEELDKLIKNSGDDYKIDAQNENPVSSVYYVKIKNINDIEETANDLKQLPQIDHVVSGAKEVKKTQSSMRMIVDNLFKASIGTLCISFLLLFILIRANIKKQQTKIEVQKLVGATNKYIKAPFIYNGILAGLIGSIFGVLIILPIYNTIYLKYNGTANGILTLYASTKVLPQAAIITALVSMLFSGFINFITVRPNQIK